MANSPAAGFIGNPEFLQASPLLLSQAAKVTGPSYIDVEPLTGKTIGGRGQAQFSISTSSPASGAYDLFYKEAYQGPFLPVIFVTTQSELNNKDAKVVRGTFLTHLPTHPPTHPFLPVIFVTTQSELNRKDAKLVRGTYSFHPPTHPHNQPTHPPTHLLNSNHPTQPTHPPTHLPKPRRVVRHPQNRQGHRDGSCAGGWVDLPVGVDCHGEGVQKAEERRK